MYAGPRKLGRTSIARRGPALHEINKRWRVAVGTKQAIYNATECGATTNAPELLNVITTLTLKAIVSTSRADVGTRENKTIRPLPPCEASAQ